MSVTEAVAVRLAEQLGDDLVAALGEVAFADLVDGVAEDLLAQT